MKINLPTAAWAVTSLGVLSVSACVVVPGLNLIAALILCVSGVALLGINAYLDLKNYSEKLDNALTQSEVANTNAKNALEDLSTQQTDINKLKKEVRDMAGSLSWKA